jgi:hypothetical protein
MSSAVVKRWEPQFDVYEARLDTDRLIIRVDLAARAHLPVATHPLRLTVSVAMRSPDSDGLRSREESVALFALEDELIPILEQELDGIFVCAMMARGRQQWTVYVPVDRQERVEAAVASCRSSYPLRTTVVADAEWSGYARSYPTPRAMQMIWNGRLVATLQEKGDVSTIERTIDHRALFPSERAAREAAVALQDRGFVTQTPTVMSDQRWALDFTHSGACMPPLPDRWTGEILDVVVPLGGHYDGWGCVVMTGPLH